MIFRVISILLAGIAPGDVFGLELSLVCKGKETISALNKSNEVIYSTTPEEKIRSIQIENGIFRGSEIKQASNKLSVVTDRPLTKNSYGITRQRYNLEIDRFSGQIDESTVLFLDDGSISITRFSGNCEKTSKRF